MSFAVTTDNNRIINGGGKGVQRWSADPVNLFPTSTVTAATAVNSLVPPPVGTSFLSSSLAGITPITFANTTITQGRPVPAAVVAAIDPLLMFPGVGGAESK